MTLKNKRMSNKTSHAKKQLILAYTNPRCRSPHSRCVGWPWRLAIWIPGSERRTCDLPFTFLLTLCKKRHFLWKEKPCQVQVCEQAHCSHPSEDPSEAHGKVEPRVGSSLGCTCIFKSSKENTSRAPGTKVSIQPLGKVAFLLKHTAPSTGQKKWCAQVPTCISHSFVCELVGSVTGDDHLCVCVWRGGGDAFSHWIFFFKQKCVVCSVKKKVTLNSLAWSKVSFNALSWTENGIISTLNVIPLSCLN